MGKLANKVAVVTGASKGIGAEIARALAAEGASVVVNYGTSQADADKVVHDITAAGGRAVAIRGNVAKSADVERLLAEAVREFWVIDVLVNNAGVYSFSAINSFSEEEFHRQFDTNVLGVLLAIRESLKHFGPNGGSIINIGSVASRLAPPQNAIYVATKSAVDGLTRALAKESDPEIFGSTRSIRVSSRPREHMPLASSAVSSNGRRYNRPRLAGSANRRISRRLRYSLLPMMPAG